MEVKSSQMNALNLNKGVFFARKTPPLSKKTLIPLTLLEA